MSKSRLAASCTNSVFHFWETTTCSLEQQQHSAFSPECTWRCLATVLVGFHPTLFTNNHPHGYRWSGVGALICGWLKEDGFFFLPAIGMSSWEKFLSVTFAYLYFNAVILLLLLCSGKTRKNIKSNITQVLNALTIINHCKCYILTSPMASREFCSILKRGKMI